MCASPSQTSQRKVISSRVNRFPHSWLSSLLSRKIGPGLYQKDVQSQRTSVQERFTWLKRHRLGLMSLFQSQKISLSEGERPYGVRWGEYASMDSPLLGRVPHLGPRWIIGIQGRENPPMTADPLLWREMKPRSHGSPYHILYDMASPLCPRPFIRYRKDFSWMGEKRPLTGSRYFLRLDTKRSSELVEAIGRCSMSYFVCPSLDFLSSSSVSDSVFDDHPLVRTRRVYLRSEYPFSSQTDRSPHREWTETGDPGDHARKQTRPEDPLALVKLVLDGQHQATYHRTPIGRRVLSRVKSMLDQQTCYWGLAMELVHRVNTLHPRMRRPFVSRSFLHMDLHGLLPLSTVAQTPTTQKPSSSDSTAVSGLQIPWLDAFSNKLGLGLSVYGGRVQVQKGTSKELVIQSLQSYFRSMELTSASQIRVHPGSRMGVDMDTGLFDSAESTGKALNPIEYQEDQAFVEDPEEGDQQGGRAPSWLWLSRTLKSRVVFPHVEVISLDMDSSKERRLVLITMNEVGHLLSTRVNRKKPMMLNARWNSTRRSDRGERGRLHGFKPLGVDLFEEGYHSRLPVLPHGEVSFQEFLKSKSLDQQRGFFGSLTRVHLRFEDPHRCLMDPTRDALDQHPVDLVSEQRRQRKKGLRGRERIQGCSMTAWNLVTQSLRSRDSLRRATLDLQERKERNPKTYYEWCGHRLRRSPRKRV